MPIEDASPEAEPTSMTTNPSPAKNDWVGLLLGFGAVLVAVGVIAGFVLAVEQSGSCDFGSDCSHPHVALGVILVGASVFAGILLALVGVVARRIEQTLSSGSTDEERRSN
jgi:hypothetical protein